MSADRDELTVRGHWSPGRYAFEIFATVEKGEQLGLVKPLEVEFVEPGAMREPTMILTETAAEALMADLWNAGFRPRGARESADLVAALREHRDDAVRVRDRALDIVLEASRP